MARTLTQVMFEMVQRLPDDCTWDDVMYEIYVRQKIAAGLEDVELGRLVPHEDVLKGIESPPS
jgi:predicted transcriptional regulator